jgi:hypothetical protein
MSKSKKPTARTSKKLNYKTNTGPSFSRRNWLFGGALVALAGVITLSLSSAFTVKVGSPIRFEIGGPSFEASDGILWETAGITTDGTDFVSDHAIANPEPYVDQQVYQTQKKGITNITVPNLPNGRYKINFFFADTESTAKNQRTFAIYAEGEEEEDSLDIFRKAGGTDRALLFDISNAKVKDGELNITFKPIKGEPILSALEIIPKKLDDPHKVSNLPEPTPTNPPTSPTPQPTPEPTEPSQPVEPVPLPSGGRQLNVTNSEQLTSAINNARPGDIIKLADGRYTGKQKVGKYTASFVATTSGTAEKPIVLTGSRDAIIDGDGQGGHYGFYLVGANYWRVQGITVTDATKGVVLDSSNYCVFDGIHITQTGQEGIHFRVNSSHNTLMNSEVDYTGARNATYGEGVYIGSANSNWGTYNNGQPDRSDYNQVLNNRIRFTGAESMDIKEGTTGGIIKGNTIDGSGMSGSWADSWLDVKGNNYTITDNVGYNALLDGFQIHVAIKGWGNNNYFANNTANVNGPGYGLSVQSGTTGNVWKCNNIVNNAAKGTAVVNGKTPLPCTP